MAPKTTNGKARPLQGVQLPINGVKYAYEVIIRGKISLLREIVWLCDRHCEAAKVTHQTRLTGKWCSASECDWCKRTQEDRLEQS